MSALDEGLILERLDKLTQAVLGLEQLMDAKLQALEERMDAKLQALEERIDERMDRKLADLEERLTGKFESRLNELRADIRTDLEGLSARLDIIKEAVDRVDSRMANVENLLEYHQAKWVEHDKEIWTLKLKLKAKDM